MKKILIAVATALFAVFAHAQVATDIHYCKCDNPGEVQGASLLCAPGSDSNDGLTPSTPKLTLPAASVLNALGGGSFMRHCEGGFWDGLTMVQFENYNSTAANPITWTSYPPPSGAVGRPGFRVAGSGTLYQFGGFFDTTWRGGYVFRNMAFYGPAGGGSGAGAFTVNKYVQDITFDNVWVQAFYGGLFTGSYDPGETRCRRMLIQDSTFYRNPGNGLLGSCSDMTLRRSLFQENNAGGGLGQHAVYNGSRNLDGNMVYEDLTFIDNSLNASNVCVSGNLTIRGSKNQVRVSRIFIKVPNAADTCYGISLTTGYGDYAQEVLYRTVIDGLTTVNVGKAIVAQITPQALIQNVRCWNDLSAPGHSCVTIENSDEAPESSLYIPSGTIVRNVSCYLGGTSGAGGCISYNDREGLNAGTSFQAYNNVAVLGSGTSSRCWNVFATTARFAYFDYNWCYNQGSGGYSAWHGNLAEAQAAEFDPHGGNTNPQLNITAPTAWNDTALQVQAGSPLIGAGRNVKPQRDYLGCLRSSPPTIGAHEYGGSSCTTVRTPLVK